MDIRDQAAGSVFRDADFERCFGQETLSRRSRTSVTVGDSNCHPVERIVSAEHVLLKITACSARTVSRASDPTSE
jgi:hypothetical protein